MSLGAGTHAVEVTLLGAVERHAVIGFVVVVAVAAVVVGVKVGQLKKYVAIVPVELGEIVVRLVLESLE